MAYKAFTTPELGARNFVQQQLKLCGCLTGEPYASIKI